MKIELLCVGKLKESYLREACKEYEKRLSRYCKLVITELPDEKTKEDASEAENDKILKTEGERILKHISEGAFVITLEIAGTELDSVELSQKLAGLFVRGISHLQFVIGGSLGLHNDVIKRSDLHLSFSKLTFPHQLMRVMLLEQLYRSFRIQSGEPYHK
ncbi:MAG: 23S rRNA (pseudouridine(1915)-N(3))-methyltransferase RlmH [Lachnospiraceae bacterium]|nr:23S rRNA (pseudouridine(1915)-N(3))-methyltransferase RlmH [Lachnospiraceae bacterium]